MDLKTYLETTGESGAAFAKRAGLVASVVTRLVNGAREPSHDTAYAIQRATDGRVSLEDWQSPAAVAEGARMQDAAVTIHAGIEALSG